MYRIIRILLLAAAPLLFNACASNSSEGCQPASGEARVETVRYKSNPSCSACKATIEGALAKTEGVESANLNLADSVVTIQYVSTQTCPDRLKQTILDTDYEANDL